MSDTAGYQGSQKLNSSASDYNTIALIVQDIISQNATISLVLVKGVNATGLNPVGTVDVQPMVAQIDGFGNATPHGTIYSLPYFRLQGGANAVILDPQAGDIGLAAFSSHDISSVKANKTPSNPGSWRRFDWSDGLYIGGFLNGAPSQYVQFSSDGIKVLSPSMITLQAPVIMLEGNVTVSGDTDLKNGAGSPIETVAGPSSVAKA
jgi:hypothetical protein